MTCERFNDWIEDAINGTLNPDLEATLKAHLGHCSGCQQAFAEEQRLFGSIDRALTKSYDREPAPDFAARIRSRLGEERELDELRTWSTPGVWLPRRVLTLALLVVVLLSILWLTRPASFRRVPLTASPTASAVIPMLNNGPKRVNQAQTSASQTHGPHSIQAVAHFHNRRTTMPERRAPDTSVLVHPGQWDAIVQMSLAAQAVPTLRGSPAVETVKLEEPDEIKGVELKPVILEAVKIEPVEVREVVIDADF